MSKRFLSSILFSALALNLSAAPATAQGRQSAIEAEEYAVYSAVVTEIGARDWQEALLVWDHTLAKGVPASSQVDEIVAELIEDFNRKNARSYPLGNDLRPRRPFRYVNEESMREIWELATFPPPIITLSRVGFNGAKDRALVYVSYGRGVMNRREQFVVLHKEKTGWRVARKLAVFIPLRPV